MNGLLTAARSKVDQAEMYWARRRRIDVLYRDYTLDRVSLDDLSSVSLRVIDDGRLGVSFGVTPDQREMIDQAKAAAAHGGRSVFDLAPAAEVADVDSFSDESSRLRSEDIVKLCEGIKELVQRRRPDISLMITARVEATTLAVETTQGACGEHRRTVTSVAFGAPVKGAGTGVYKAVSSVQPLDVPEALIEEFLEWYSWTETVSVPATGRLPVILSPEASFLFALPLCAGISGDAVARKTSPVFDRVGEIVVGDALTVRDEPLLAGSPFSRPFDDEGVPCTPRTLVEKGVLRGLLADRFSGAKLGTGSTGNGHKRELFRSGTEVPVHPWPTHLVIDPGEGTLAEMVARTENGVLLYSGMGFHSGNYPQGQFAVQGVGFHVLDGKVVGRLEGTMVAGSIYQDFLDVAVSGERREVDGLGGPVLAPYLRVGGLQVAGRP